MAVNNDHVEKLILDFSRYILSKINSFNYQKYGIEQDDLLQDIRIRIWKVCVHNNNNIRNYQAYIKKIVNSVVVDEIQKSRKAIKALEFYNHGSLNRDYYCRERNVAHKENFKETLIHSLNGLKRSRRKVLHLYLSGFTVEEIAELHNWSLGKTNNLFYRGLKDLKNILKVQEIFYED